MCKKIRRILSLALAILLTAAALLLVPTSASAAGVDQVKQQIKRTYKKACSYFDRDSFDGLCGTLVTAELYFMGINTGMVFGDGNDQYDLYCNKKYSSGGYRIKAYSPKLYTLKQALNAITDNGTEDAYNILVGFQKTKSTLGKRYGHATVIHAIIDGTIYFMESYEMRIGGRTYPEGVPISCSIDEFCRYYGNSTTEYDGVIYFGLKKYTEKCKSYSANLSAVVTEGCALKSQPCDSTVDESSELVHAVEAGDQLTITGLYLNTEGEYWYQVVCEQEAYIPADRVKTSKLFFDDVSILAVKAPTVLRQGKSFYVEGTVMARINSLYSIRAQIYKVTEDQETLVVTASEVADSKSFDLDDSDISQKLTFRKLSAGTYRYELAAVVGNYYIENGQLQIGWDTVQLWTSQFRVTEQKASGKSVTFDACGGTVDMNQTVVLDGQPLEKLPAAKRAGYVFLGWYTAAEDGEQVSGGYVPDSSGTLYARWISYQDLRTLWESSGQYRYFYSDGLSTMGCVEMDGTLYYFSSVDALGQSWNIWTGVGTTKN